MYYLRQLFNKKVLLGITSIIALIYVLALFFNNLQGTI